MNILYPIPEIGAKGSFVLAAPFSGIMLPGEIYSCMAVRNIADYIANNEDVLTTAYLNNTLTINDYNADLAVNMSIASLQSQTGHWLYVPARFFEQYPSSNGIPYHNLMLGVYLGALPVSLDLSFLEAAVSNVVIDNIGVKPQIKVVETSKTTSISAIQDASVTATRNAIKTAALTDTGKYQNLQLLYSDALVKIAALEAFIVKNNPTLIG